MNAALIAACATVAHRKKELPLGKAMRELPLYYKVRFRKYYYFDALTIVTPDHERLSGSVYAPIKTLMLKPVRLDAKTFAVEQNFPIAAAKCTNGVDSYVKDNFERFTADYRWRSCDEDIFNKYAKELMTKYGVQAAPGSLNYTVQYHWEVLV